VRLARAATSDSDTLVRLLAKILAPHLREHLSIGTDGTVKYYHQGDSPLGKRRHLDLVRRGVLAGHKVGRRVLVRCDEVHRYLETRKAACRANELNADDPLEDWGLERAGQP
jgi:excisionase family DNA binding protein